MNQSLKRMLQVVRKTLTVGAAVALPAAILAVITAAPAHAAIYRTGCGAPGYSDVLAITKTAGNGENLCFSGTGILDGAIYGVGNINNASDRWVTLYYVDDLGGPVAGRFMPPHTAFGATDFEPGHFDPIHMITRFIRH